MVINPPWFIPIAKAAAREIKGSEDTARIIGPKPLLMPKNRNSLPRVLSLRIPASQMAVNIAPKPTPASNPAGQSCSVMFSVKPAPRGKIVAPNFSWDIAGSIAS